VATATGGSEGDRAMLVGMHQTGRRNSDCIMCTTHVTVDRELVKESDDRT
jgi:hypothetical protein